jgi:hypothetical protein
MVVVGASVVVVLVVVLVWPPAGVVVRPTSAAPANATHGSSAARLRIRPPGVCAGT